MCIILPPAAVSFLRLSTLPLHLPSYRTTCRTNSHRLSCPPVPLLEPVNLDRGMSRSKGRSRHTCPFTHPYPLLHTHGADAARCVLRTASAGSVLRTVSVGFARNASSAFSHPVITRSRHMDYLCFTYLEVMSRTAHVRLLTLVRFGQSGSQPRVHVAFD